MSYQGHMPDGSSVQRHSAGSHYPYVVGAKQTEEGLRWFVLTPDGVKMHGYWRAEDAFDAAEACAKAHRQCQRTDWLNARAAA